MRNTLLMLWIVAFLLAMNAVAAEQEYITVIYQTGQMPVEVRQEKAWVVSPHVVITMPETALEVMTICNGLKDAQTLWYYANHPKFRIKAYISRYELTVSPDLPEPIIKAYEILVPHIEAEGGLSFVIDRLKRENGVYEIEA